MILHAIKNRDAVTGEFVTRCGLKAHRDHRALPRGPLVDEVYATFRTALHERDVDCAGCRLPLSAVGAWALQLLDHGAVLREDATYSVNSEVRPPVVYMPRGQIDALLAVRLVTLDGCITPLGKSLAERNSK